jgi:hypothetical protein
VQDGGRVGRVGLEGGPGDRMSERVSRCAGAASTKQRGGQLVLLDDTPRQTTSGDAKAEEAAHRDVDYKHSTTGSSVI